MLSPQYRRHRAQRAFERNIDWCTRNLGLIPDEGFVPVLEFLHWLLDECGPGTVATQNYGRQLKALEELIAARRPRAPHPPVPARPRLRVVK